MMRYQNTNHRAFINSLKAPMPLKKKDLGRSGSSIRSRM
jgi:hypothetical protein